MKLLPSAHPTVRPAFPNESHPCAVAAKFSLRAAAFSLAIVSIVVLLCAQPGFAQTSYYRHIFFDNGPHTSSYYYSFGKAVEPSTLEIHDKKLPLDPTIFFTPPNALRISWRSNPGGSWAAQIKVLEFRDREILFEGNTLSFWLYSPEAISVTALPNLRLHDTNRGFSAILRLGEFSAGIPAKKWT